MVEKVLQVRCCACKKVLFEVGSNADATIFKKCERCGGTNAIACRKGEEPRLVKFTPKNVALRAVTV